MRGVIKALGAWKLLVNLLIWALKNNWIKFSWNLPGSPILYTKITAAFDDKHITDAELLLIFEQLKVELDGTFGEKVVDALIWVLQLVAPIDWSIEGKWEKLWKPIVESVSDDKLTNTEIGQMIETFIRW